MLPERAGRLPHYSWRKTIRRKNESHFRGQLFKLSKIVLKMLFQDLHSKLSRVVMNYPTNYSATNGGL